MTCVILSLLLYYFHNFNYKNALYEEEIGENKQKER